MPAKVAKDTPIGVNAPKIRPLFPWSQLHCHSTWAAVPLAQSFLFQKVVNQKENVDQKRGNTYLRDLCNSVCLVATLLRWSLFLSRCYKNLHIGQLAVSKGS